VDHFQSYDKVLAAFYAQQRAEQPAWTRRTATRVATAESLHGRHELRKILQERNFALL
jgi:hypothetical protein